MNKKTDWLMWISLSLIIAVVVFVSIAIVYHKNYTDSDFLKDAGCSQRAKYQFYSGNGDPFLEGYYTEEGTCAYTPFSDSTEAYLLYVYEDNEEKLIQEYAKKLPIVQLDCEKSYVLKVFGDCEFE